MVKSLAKSNREYADIQGRIRDGVLHIQGSGNEVNRDYGVAVDVEVPPEFAAWLNMVDNEGAVETRPSLAGTDARYVPMQVADRGEDTHIQVAADVKYNRLYGAAFNVEGYAANLLDQFADDTLDSDDESDEDDDTPDGVAIF